MKLKMHTLKGQITINRNFIYKIMNCAFIYILLTLLNLKSFPIPSLIIITILWSQYLNFYDYYSYKSFYKNFKTINGWKIWIRPVFNNQVFLFILILLFTNNIILISKLYIVFCILSYISILVIIYIKKLNYIMVMIYLTISNIGLIVLKYEMFSYFYWMYKYLDNNNLIINNITLIVATTLLVYSFIKLLYKGVKSETFSPKKNSLFK